MNIVQIGMLYQSDDAPDTMSFALERITASLQQRPIVLL